MSCIFGSSKEKAESNLLANCHNTSFCDCTAYSSLTIIVSPIYSEINKSNYSYSIYTELICKLNSLSLTIFPLIFCFINLTPNLSYASSNAK